MQYLSIDPTPSIATILAYSQLKDIDRMRDPPCRVYNKDQQILRFYSWNWIGLSLRHAGFYPTIYYYADSIRFDKGDSPTQFKFDILHVPHASGCEKVG